MIHELFNLHGKVAVVTGASSGIGRALAGYVAWAGATVVLVARREAALADMAEEIRGEGGSASALPLDLLNLASLNEAATSLAEPFGPPVILVNAAGVNLRQPPDEVTLDSWRHTIDLNLSAPFFLARCLVPGMRAQGYGRIINIASVQSRRAFENGMAYGASKGGVEQLTRAMAQAWSPQGITANAIAPGFFPTELTAPVFNNPKTAAWAADQTTMGRTGEMPDLAGAAIFLASAGSAYVTGQMLFVDGGFTAT